MNIRVDVYEGKSDWMLLADLPGMKAEDVHVELNGRELSIDGEGLVRRVFTVPDGVEDVTATLTDGVLHVRMPKPATLTPRRIEVRSA